jgi:hypothetical protein
MPTDQGAGSGSQGDAGEALREAARLVSQRRDQQAAAGSRGVPTAAEIADAIELRGVDPNLVSRLASEPAQIPPISIWTKVYTENCKAQLVDRQTGRVLYETQLPLTQQELDLIDRLGLRR